MADGTRNAVVILSGGQTGADRAALDVALELGLGCGGWCPRGRRAEDGPIPDRYPLRETPSAAYPQRTQWNVRDADATLVLHAGRTDRGTALTERLAKALGKPLRMIDVRTAEPGEVTAWIERERIVRLNVAGPRESGSPGLQAAAAAFLRQALGGLAGRVGG